jgi:hypothetical protein
LNAAQVCRAIERASKWSDLAAESYEQDMSNGDAIPKDGIAVR